MIILDTNVLAALMRTVQALRSRDAPRLPRETYGILRI